MNNGCICCTGEKWEVLLCVTDFLAPWIAWAPVAPSLHMLRTSDAPSSSGLTDTEIPEGGAGQLACSPCAPPTPLLELQ